MTDAIATERVTREPVLSASVDYDVGDADDGMIASARAFTADFLTASPAVGRRPVPRERIDLARLVVSELVTNALRHAPGPCRLLLELFDEVVEISVFDRVETSP
ncbi:ATP-binding protein, partial [Streptomyces albidoflavus]